MKKKCWGLIFIPRFKICVKKSYIVVTTRWQQNLEEGEEKSGNPIRALDPRRHGGRQTTAGWGLVNKA